MTPTTGDLFERVHPRTTSARRVVESAYRLDASHFAHGAEDARTAMASSFCAVSPLGELADVFALSDFSLMRIPAAPSRGVPFLTVSDILEWIPEPSMFLSKKYEPHLDDYVVREGCILLSRSGTIGRTLIVGRELAGKAVANHAIRIIAKTPDVAALIFLSLSGAAGQQILSSYTYGSVVGEIKPAQIEQIPIPLPSDAVRAELRKLVDAAVAARDDAFYLHQEATADVLTANGLNELPSADREGTGTQDDPLVVVLGARSIGEELPGMSECRLDAHFYNPTAQRAVENIKKCRAEVKTVGELALQVVMGPRFKRNYVESSRGVPFLSGKNIVQIRPTDLKYLSNLQMADMQELLVKRGWTLITCSGTIGRTCFVWGNYEDYAASQHILRVIPNEAEIDPGYLYAFLSSRYGYEQTLRYRHGSVIDEITDTQIGHVLVPRPSAKEQLAIGDKVRWSYERRAEALRLEDEAQSILMRALTGGSAAKGA